MTPDSKDYEDALRLCISLGGDADTMGAITGAIAGAYYHQMPASLYEFGINKLPEDIKDIINKFDQEHGHMVSYKWYNPEFPKEELVRKVRSGEIFIWGMKMSERGNNKWKEKDVTLWLPVYRIL